jgi:multiple sugar transport system permease protein
VKPREFWPFVTPSVIIMSALMVFPLLFTVYLSFQNYTLGNPMAFVGLDNYARTLNDPQFWNTVGFTLLYVAAVVPLQIGVGFVLALLLNEITRGKRWFISGYLIPFIVTPVVGTLVVAWLFRDRGFFTYLLSLVGIDIQWYADPWAARALIVLYGVWATAPFSTLMLYAGMQAMPAEPLEAARVDGASWLESVWHVVIPALRPIFLFIVMVALMDGFRLFDPVAVMTRGGPGGATETVMFYAYNVSFGQGLLGRGSAVVMISIVMILILLLPSLRRTYRDIVRRPT